MKRDSIQPSVEHSRSLRARERGFVLITMALATIALIGVLGVSADIGRIFIAKNESQAYCDSAALAAALMLDGTSNGIANAQNAVTNSLNTWNFNTTTLPAPTVEFASLLAGTWSSNPTPATGYIYTRVATTVPVTLYFLRAIVGQTTQNVITSAKAGQIDLTTFPRGLSPYTAVAASIIGPYYGLTVGNSYDIQWPAFNSTRAGCSASNPDKCFVSSPCSGDTKAARAAVTTSWGSSNSGYWGASSNSTIEKEILDLIQLQPVAVGTNIQPALSNGTKASEAGYLDERASQDANTTDNEVTAYLTSAHNGRRLIPVPVVNPVSDLTTTVVGYGQFLLLANGPGTSDYYRRNTNGNDPFCAIYAGPYVVGAAGPGAGGTIGASRVGLVE